MRRVGQGMGLAAMTLAAVFALGAGARAQDTPPPPPPPVFPTAPPTTSAPARTTTVTRRTGATTAPVATTTTTSPTTTTTTTITLPPASAAPVALPPEVKKVESTPLWIVVLLAVSVAINLAVAGAFLNQRFRSG